MATPDEIITMKEIEIVVNLWKSNQIPTWRAIQKIGALAIEQQKRDLRVLFGNVV